MKSEEPGLYWAVKSSLNRYVRSLDDGEIAVADGASVATDGIFRFPLVSVDDSTDRTVLRHRGSVSYSGYFGMLNIRLADPVVRIGAGRGELSVSVDGREVLIAEFPAESPGSGAQELTCTDVRLTEHGAPLFGATYSPGEQLAGLRIITTEESTDD